MSNAPKPIDGILNISPYVPGKSSASKDKADNETGRIIKLSSNESPLGASEKAKEAYREQAATLHRYPDGSATALREAIAGVYGLDASRIVCGAGSDELIGLLIKSYAGPGDEVLYAEHGFLMYRIYALAAGAVPVTAPEEAMTASVDSLLAKVSDRTKLVFIANPNNPTGTYISAAELKRLRDGLPGHVILVVDGAYAEYVSAEDYSNGLELVNATDNTVMLRTFSKIYALPALRIGWGYMPPAIADVLNRVRGPFNVSSASIAAATAAVQDTPFVTQSVKHNDTWLPALAQGLRECGLTPMPSAGNFLLAHCGSAEKASALAAYLVTRGIYVREVAGYGLPDYLRITVGLEDENMALLAAIKDYMDS